MKQFLAAIAVLCAAPAIAQDWDFRQTDRVLSREEVDLLTSGRTIAFYDDGQSRYSAGGSYSYTYASGESAFGVYAIEADGTVCVSYRNGFGRCDKYVENAGRIILLTERGLRFPIRPDP